MGMRRRSSQKQQQSVTDAAVTGAFAETAPKAFLTKSQSDTAPKEKPAKGVCRRSAQRQQQRASKAAKHAAVTETTPTALRSTSQNDTSKLKPGFDDVFASIESLYADDLKPFGRILRKRVAERAMLASGVAQCYEENVSDVDVRHIHTICAEDDSLQVQPEEGGDWSVTIIGRPDTFVDVYSSLDVYPEGMWGAAAAYFQLISGDDMYLPGGRYSCAQELQARSLAFLGDRSLGQVCHIVQLAISQKKLLGYLNGAVVPYAFSQSMLKEQCAQRNAVCSASGNDAGTAATESSLSMATWDIARQFLREILNDSAKSNPDLVGMVPLSNVKRLFRSKFHTELSETKLGHSKLTHLLQDDRFSDICEVQLQGHGYIVTQVVPQEENHTICLQDALPADEGDLPMAFSASEPITLAMNESGVLVGSPTAAKARWPPAHGRVRSLVQRTFIHAALPPPTPPPNARRRSASLPKDAGSVERFLELPWGSLARDQAEETDSTVDSANGSDGAELSRSSSNSRSMSRPSGDDPVKVLLRECNLAATMEPMRVEESADVLDSAGDVQPKKRILFCPDEPLALEEAGSFLDSAPVTQTPYTPTAPMWSWRMPSSSSIEDERVETEPNRCRLFCPDEPLALDLEEAESLFDGALFPQTPFTPLGTPSWPCLAPLPLLIDGWPGTEKTSFYVDDSETPPRFQFCPDEPLDLEEAGAFIDPFCFKGAPASMSPQQSSRRWPCLSPSTLVRDGCFGSIALSRVQNTFIHSPAKPLHSLPPTPMRVGASRRSASLPKNTGSDKNLWEATCQALGCSQVPRSGEDFSFHSGNCPSTPSVYVELGCSQVPRSGEDFSFHSGDCPSTPSVYVDYIVPPSPDFPTYCNKHQLGSDASPAVFADAAWPPQMTDAAWPPQMIGDYIWPASSSYLPSVIRLSDFLQ